MSRLTRAVRQLREGVRWYDNILDDISLWWERNSIRTLYYSIRNFLKNILFFSKLAWNWRPWDYTYSVQVLIALLEKQAYYSRYHGHCVLSEHWARRMYTAAGLLRIAYIDDDTKWQDVQYKLASKYPPSYRKLDSGYTQLRMEKPPHAEAMYKLAGEKHEAEMERRRKNAWAYLNKYLLYFWD